MDESSRLQFATFIIEGSILRIHCHGVLNWYLCSCNLFQISTWLYTSIEVFFVSTSLKQVLFNYEENGEWDVENMYTEYNIFDDRGKDYRGVSFNFILKRKTTYYVLYIIVPVVVFNFVGAVVFTVSPGSGEKLTFSLTMLLSITVLMTIVGDKVPTSSLQLSKLCKYRIYSGLQIRGGKGYLSIIFLEVSIEY